MGDFNDLLTKLMQGQEVSESTTKESIEQMQALIKSKKELRFYVDGTPNFGHQATTINIMKRIVDATGYSDNILIVYSGENTPGKLALLLAGLDPSKIGTASVKYGGATITFLEYNGTKPELDQIDYGFTGGADDSKVNYAEVLSVNYFLRLQPYLWEKAPNQIERKDEDPYNLTDEAPNFAELAYKFSKDGFATVPDDVWLWYANDQTFDAELKVRTRNAHAIYNASVAKKTLHLWPIYGLHQFDSPAEMVLNFIISGLIAQSAKGNPTALFIMSDIAKVEERSAEKPFDYAIAFAKDLAAKNSALPNLKAAIKKVYIDDDMFNYYAQVSLDSFILKLGQQLKDIIDEGYTLKIVEGFVEGKYIELSDLQTTLQAAGTKEMVAITLGPVPQEIYNYFYANSGLPGVFEGQGSSSLPISLGQPFLQIPKTGEDDRANYPSTLSAVSYSVVSQTAKTAAVNFRNQGLDPYLRKTNPTTPQNYYDALNTSASFMVSSFIESNPLQEYFSNLGVFYQNDIHDKLMLGIVGVKLVSPSVSVEFAKVKLENSKLNGRGDSNGGSVVLLDNEALTLEDVYNKLVNNYKDGGVNLLDALPNTYLASFFKKITGNLFFIKVDKDNITQEKDGSTVTKVSLTDGTTTAFGPDFSITLNFTSPESAIVTEIDTVLNKQWNIDGIPWIGFEKPGFNLKINEGGSPVEGGMKGNIIGTGKDGQGNPIVLETIIQYPEQEDLWLISGGFSSPVSISSFFQMAGGVNLVQVLQPPLNGLAGFGLKDIQLKYDNKKHQFAYMSYQMSTDTPWVLSENPKFQINPTVDVQIYNVQDVANRKTEFTVNGDFTIGKGTVTVLGTYPPFKVNGGLSDGVIELSDLLALFGAELDLETSVTLLDFNVQPNEKFYQLDTILEADKPLNIADLFTINKLTFNVVHNSGTNEISIGGVFVVLPESMKIGLTLQSSYATGNGWTFSGTQTSGALEIGQLLTFYINPTWQPADGFNYAIDGLGFKINTQTKYWSFSGKTAKPWEIEFLDLKVSGNAQVAYGKKDKDTPVGYFGNVHATVNWIGIELEAFYDFDPKVKSYGVTWGILKGVVTNTGTAQAPNYKAELGFTESTTIGSMIETMVSWATGTKFGLSAPWNILDSIPLNNLKLTYDFTKKQVGFSLDIGPISLGFATIKSIGVTYKSNQPKPEDNGVIVNLEGSFLWQDDSSEPLTWDAAKPETTPAPSGQGNKYLDLRLLAMGQHVTIPGFQNVEKVQDAIKIMSELPDTDPGKIPDIQLDANSNWLIGMDFGVLKLGDDKKKNQALASASDASQYFITLQMVFNDPNLYALRLALEGEPARIFKGLDFQILYKKISDTIGVYKAEIALPTIMRKIQLGQVNLTLPIFGIELFTNGDFQVDIGFPWKEDFSRSFIFQTLIWTPVGIPIPVMGSAGVYFGKLSSATTNKVPDATNGTFNPVLVFGFGMQFGLGYDFEAGVLKAGFSLTVVAILEGVLAKFNPYQLGTTSASNNAQVAEAYYFWFRGTVGIIGKLYGSVDFAIIKAELNIDIRILAQMTFSPYDPIVLQLSASVSVSLKVKINLGLFKITMSFSFSASIKQSVTIKAIASNPPWQTETNAKMLTASNQIPRLNSKQLRIDAFSPLVLGVLEAVSPNWSNLKQAATPAPLTGYLGLGLTMAGDKATELSQQQACYVSMLFIESMAPPQEDQESGYQNAFKDGTDTSFETLSKEIFRWIIAAIQSAPLSSEQVDETPVTTAQLTQLIAYFGDPNNPSPIPTTEIDAFMTDQFLLTVQEQPTEQTDVNGTFFPMAMSLQLSTSDYGDNYKGVSYDFGSYNTISSSYIDDLRKYFDELAIKMQEEDPNTYAKLASNGDVSVGNFVFSDYFLLIGKQMVQSAQDSLKEFVYFVNDGDTPDAIVQWVNDNGDLSGSMAYTVQELFDDNVSIPLTVDKTMYIPNSTYTVQQGDTFDSIAAQSIYGKSFDGSALATLNKDAQNTLQSGIKIAFTYKDFDYNYVTLPSQSLEEVVTAINATVPDANKIDSTILIQDGGVTTLENLLLPVATLSIGLVTYITGDGDTLRSIASKFNVTPQDIAIPVDKDHNNGAIKDLFDTASLGIANLEQFKVGELLKEIQATQGLQHLSGMTSRYYLAGLKLPVDGVTPNFSGMWVEDDGGNLSYGNLEFAGLYALDGQQFAIPELVEGKNFDITFSKPDSLSWFDFAGKTPDEMVIEIVPGSEDAIRINKVIDYAITNKLDTGLTFLGVADLFTNKEASYPYTSEIIWNAAAPISLPYGGTPDGVPALSLWELPDTLLQLPDTATRAINPRMEFVIGQYDPVTKEMVNHDIPYYGLGSLVEVTIKKVPVVSNSPSTLTTYEVVGANSNNANILEKIVSEIGDNDSLIASLIPAYQVDANGSTNEGIQTDAQGALTMGLAQVNLSTETRPDVAFDLNLKAMAEVEGEDITLLNTPTDFLRLLWQAAITRNGGYYLYYYNADNKQGLPDRIFDDNGEATMAFVVLYSKSSDTNLQNTVTSYMNVFANGVAFDKNTSVLFAQSDPITVKLPTDATQTLDTLAYQYYGNVADVATDNQSLTLRDGIKITISEGVYQAGVGGTTLEDVAKRFDTTVDDIQAINKAKSGNELPDNLALFTAIFLPKLIVTIGTSPGGTTLASLEDFYGENLTSIANNNQTVVGIFADSQEVNIAGGPKIRTSNVAAGTTSIKALRPEPAPVPDDPNADNYGELFLQNVYSSLTYQVVENAYFESSNLGLPSGPTTDAKKAETQQKVGVPNDANDDQWKYQINVPYAGFSKKDVINATGLPDASKSPYRGLGTILQVDFAWQDIYGNSIISELSDPSADSKEPLNEPPVLTGYTDAIIGLNQWPSVASSWAVTGKEGEGQLQVALDFDNSYYQGLISAEVKSDTTILAQYTSKVDKDTATNVANYTIDQNITIKSIALSADEMSVTITTEASIPAGVTITLNISNVKSASESNVVYNGLVKFDKDNDAKIANSTVREQAIRDLQVYTQLWYQLTDPNGIAYHVKTTLVDTPYSLTTDDIDGLVEQWIASIYKFIEDRSQGGITVDTPDNEHLLSFAIASKSINTEQIFKLELSFEIERTGGAISGDFETTGGIKSVSATVPPLTKATSGDTTGLEDFAIGFETALSQSGVYQLRVTSGIDRDEALNNSNTTEIWATRLGLDQKTAIGYEINNEGAPTIYAPQPISNKLETKDQVPIYYFDPKTGIDFKEPSTHIDFKNIDMDLWGQQIFESIDGVLTPEFTAAIQLVDKNSGQEYLEDMLANKKRLAEVIKQLMVPVFEDENGAETTDIQESFLQQLLVKLSNAYTTRAGVQFEATVQAETVENAEDIPQLYGNINLNLAFMGAEIDMDDATKVNLFFSNFLTKETAETVSNYSVSDDIMVSTATLDSDNARIVTLKLNKDAVVGTTIVTIVDTLKDELGNQIIPPLSQTVAKSVDAGNFSTSLSLTSPKLPLSDNDKAPLPFLVSSPSILRGTDDQVLSYVDLNITYAGFAIEHQISSVPGIEDYKASSWLSFVSENLENPLETSLGSFKVPMVLRSFPTAPAMVRQDGAYPFISGADIKNLLTWNYQITYSQSFHYPQDQIDFEVNFNVGDMQNKALASFQDAFAEMAEFITVFPQINKTFDEVLVKIDATTTVPDQFTKAATALSSYNQMVSRMADAAENSGGFMLKSMMNLRFSNGAEPYKFFIKESSATIDTTTGALIVNIFGKQPEGIGTPIVNIDGYTAKSTTAIDGATYSYYYQKTGGTQILEAAIGQSIPDRKVLLPTMNILARQDADTVANLKRNVELVPGKPSASEFVYTTGSIGFSNKFHPTIDTSQEMDIATINNPSTPNIGTLQQQLTILFDTLLADNTQDTISVLMSSGYSYRANQGLSNIVLPVIMQPLQTIQVQGTGSDKSIADMITDWSNSIVDWYANNKVSDNEALLEFDLTIFSNLTTQPKPLIRLRNLILSLDFITNM